MFEFSLDFNTSDKEAEKTTVAAPVTSNADGKWDGIDLELKELFDEFDATEEETQSNIGLGRKITEASRNLRAVNKRITDLSRDKAERLKEIEDIQIAMRKRVEELREGLSEIDTQIFDLKRERAALMRQIDEFKRMLQLELDKLRKSVEFKKATAQYDIATVGREWRGKAFAHQILGGQVLANSRRQRPSAGVGQGCILGDDMGLGKTLTLLISADMMQSKKLLIICPADQTTNFEKEARRWAPHRPVVSLYKMTQLERNSMLMILKMTDEFCILINYESWRKDVMLVKTLSEMGFDTVILDEAHSIKNASTSAFQGVRDIVMAENCCGKCGSLAIKQFEFAPRRFSMVCTECSWDSRNVNTYSSGDTRSVKAVFPATGTPILNRPQELFTLLHLILPEIFEKESDFLSIYCEQDYSGYWKFKPGGLERLQKHMTGRYLARDERELKKSGIEIPKQDINYHDVDITDENYPDQYRIIQQINKHAQIVLSSGKKMTMMNQLELILRQRQANVWPGGIKLKDEDGNVVWEIGDECKESIKLDWAVGLIDTFTMQDHRCVVFSQFKDPLRVAAERLNQRGIRAVVFDGSTPHALREQIKTDFDRKYCESPGYVPKWDVVLCNYRTGGVGLNFTAATRTVVTDEEWNSGKNEQAWRRTKRIGQTEETEVHVIRLNRTVDTWLAKLIEYKSNVVSGFNMTAEEMQSEMLRGLEGGEFI